MKPEVLIVGTFHFSSSNDLINHNDLFNKEEHSNEVYELIEILKTFNPSALAAEWIKDSQNELNQQYQSYLNSEVDLSDNEIQQILFRLGKYQNINQIHAVDWMDSVGERHFGDVIEWGKENQPDLYKECLKYIPDDKISSKNSILQNLKNINAETTIFRSHQAHLKVSQIGTGINYVGIDWVRWWYQRNLIIYKNLIDVVKEGHHKVLLLIGGAHIHLVRQFLRETGEVKVLTFNDLDII